MNYREFVKTEMASRPTGVAPKVFMAEIGKKWRSMKETPAKVEKKRVSKKKVVEEIPVEEIFVKEEIPIEKKSKKSKGKGIVKVSFDNVIQDMKKEINARVVKPISTVRDAPPDNAKGKTIYEISKEELKNLERFKDVEQTDMKAFLIY